MKSPILYAVAFGKDGTDGDSSFHGNPFKCKKGDTFEQLTEGWKKKGDEYFPEDYEEEEANDNLPVGFWILDESGRKAIRAFDNGCSDAGCDSALYAQIRSRKGMIKELAIKTVKA